MMKTLFQKYQKGIVIIAAVLFVFSIWNTSASISSFFAIAIGGIAIAFLNKVELVFQKKIFVVAIIFSALITIANYDSFHWITGILFFLTGVLLLYLILFFLMHTTIQTKQRDYNEVFVYSFSFLVVIYFTCLFYFNYPGTYSPDSVLHLTEIYRNHITNIHPYLYVYLLKLLISILSIPFGNHGGAIIALLALQCIFSAFAFSYGLASIYKTKYVYVILMAYAFLPYHMNYATTLVKDSIFTYCVVIALVSVYRLLKQIGNEKISYGLFLLGVCGACLSRHNGIVIPVGLFAGLLLYWRNKKVLIYTLSCIVVCGFLQFVLPKTLGLEENDITESTSLLQQQLARAVIDHRADLEDERITELLSYEAWESSYVKDYADYLKLTLRSYGTLAENPQRFFAVYFDTGLKYPLDYIKGFIDNSRYYYNAGYKTEYNDSNRAKFYVVMNGDQPGVGIFLRGASLIDSDWVSTITRIKDRQHPLLQFVLKLDLLYAVGFHFWIFLLLFVKCIFEKRKETILCISLFFLMGSLIVFAPTPEFRYSYSLFALLPLLIPMILQEKEGESQV